MDWPTIRNHAAELIESTGQWAAILDEDLNWLCDVELESLDFDTQRNASTSFKAEVVVASTGGGLPHPAIDHLVGDDLGRVNDSGELVPVTEGARFLVVERAGRARVAGRIGFTKAKGPGDAPDTLELSGIDLMGELELIPAPNSPKSWREAAFREFDRVWGDGRDAGLVLSKPRLLAPVTDFEKVVGVTLIGPADEVIRRILDTSFDAVYQMCGLPRDQYPLAVSQRDTGRHSFEVYLRPSGGKLLADVAETAGAAGVTIVPELWLPGDGQPEGLALTLPTIVYHVLQG